MSVFIRLLGLVAFAGGIILFIFGINSMDAPVDQFFEAITGRYTKETMYYLIGGIIGIIAGFFLMSSAKRFR